MPLGGLRIRVAVIAEGGGIDADDLPHMFEPFFTRKPVGEGTGLGLDISRRIIVDNQDGDIAFESRPGETVVRVQLPLHGGPA